MADTALVEHILGSNAAAVVGATSAIKDAVTALCVLNGIAAFVLTAVSLPLLMKLLALLGTPQVIIGAAHSYIFIVMAGVTAAVAYNTFALFLRSVGNSAALLVFLCLSCALNIALDILLIPRGGMAGAALATFIAQNYGAEDKARINLAMKQSMCAVAIWVKYQRQSVGCRNIFGGEKMKWLVSSPLGRIELKEDDTAIPCGKVARQIADDSATREKRHTIGSRKK